jgi:hypothetical protein
MLYIAKGVTTVLEPMRLKRERERERENILYRVDKTDYGESVVNLSSFVKRVGVSNLIILN